MKKFNPFWSFSLSLPPPPSTELFPFYFKFSISISSGNRPTQLGYPYKSGPPCSSCEESCPRKKLCTNSCQYADNWSNCRELYTAWPDWLCQAESQKGKERLSHCKATCLCKDKIYDWFRRKLILNFCVYIYYYYYSSERVLFSILSCKY